MLEMPVFFVSSNIPLGPHKLRSPVVGNRDEKTKQKSERTEMASITLPEIATIKNRIPSIDFRELLKTYVIFCVCWQLLYTFVQACLKWFQVSNTKLLGFGRSYVCSTVNAIISSLCGAYIYFQIHDDSVLCKYFFIGCVDSSLVNFTITSCASLSAYFTMDLIGILFTYPRSKAETGAATVIHHSIFLLCGIIGSVFYLTPYIYALLNLCEISTIPLNVRWFTINTGNGNSKLYWIASYTFVLSFVVFRILVYGFSLLEVILHYDEIQQHMQDLAHEHGIKIWSTLIMFALVFLGWLLQLYWFINGILPLLFRAGKKKKKN